MNQDLYIVGGNALTMNPQLDFVEDVVIQVRGGKIESISSDSNFLPPRESRVLNTHGKLVVPGLINGHTHLPMSLLRGLAEDLPIHRWLEEVIFPAERKFGSNEFVELGTRLSCLELIRNGVTTVNDMYYYEEAVARTVHQSGLRGICGQAITAVSGVQKIDSIEKLFDRFQEVLSDFPLIQPAVSPHSCYAETEESLRKAAAYAAKHDLPVNIHLSESNEEVEGCLKKTGMRPTEYLKSLGLFETKTICAHGLCLSKGEMTILKEAGASVVYNPESNMKLGNPVCPVRTLQENGIVVGIGTDGSASNNDLDLLGEIDSGAKFQSSSFGAGALTALAAVKMLTIEGARALGLGSRIGSLEVGKQADLIAIDLNVAHAVPFYDPYFHLVYSARGSDVCHSVVQGRVLMEDRNVLGVDESALFEAARAFGRRIKSEVGTH